MQRKPKTRETDSSSPSHESALWRRMLCDPVAAAFIKKHATEFPPNSYKEDYRILKNNPSLANAQVMQIIEFCRPYDDPELETIAALYPTQPARAIAKRLCQPIKLVYQRIQKLRRVALEKFRARVEVTTEQAPLAATTAPIKRIRLTLNERDQVVSLVAKDGEFCWVNESGVPFGEEVQDLLDHHEELFFEVLDVELQEG